MFKSSLLSPELIDLLQVIDDCGATKARLKLLLKNGFIHDLFDPKAVPSDRVAFCQALDLDLARLGMYRFVVDYHKPVKNRIEECKKDFPWQIDMREDMFEGQWSGSFNSGLESDRPIETFEARLLEMPEGVSRDDVLRRIKRYDQGSGWEPADTDHMLAFATKYPEVTQQSDFKYIVGLGTTPSVLMRLFQSLASGCSFNFVPIARKWKKCHDGGKENRFLVVRPS